MQGTLMQQGFELLLFGMGTVFVFLGLLVVATTAMSSLVQRFVGPDPVAVPPGRVRPAAAADDPQLIAVISAAIVKHRARRQRPLTK